MKKVLVLGAVFSVLCYGLVALPYEGDGGRSLGSIRVGEIDIKGEKLEAGEEGILNFIPSIFRNSFKTYTNMVLVDGNATAPNTLSGTITKMPGGTFLLEFVVKDRYEVIQSTEATTSRTAEMKICQTAIDVSEALINGLKIKLTQEGRNAIIADKKKWGQFASGAENPATPGYSYTLPPGMNNTQAEQLRASLAEYLKNYKIADVDTTMIEQPKTELAAPKPYEKREIVITAKINTGANAAEIQAEYNTQKTEAVKRQKEVNDYIKEIQNDFLGGLKKQKADMQDFQKRMLQDRDKLLGQQKEVLEKQRKILQDLRDTEDYYSKYFTDYQPFELTYDPIPKQVGLSDSAKGIFDVQFPVYIIGTNAMKDIPSDLADREAQFITAAQRLVEINAQLDRIEAALIQAETAGRNNLQRSVNEYNNRIAQVEAGEKEFESEMDKLERTVSKGYAQLGKDYRVTPDSSYAARLAREYAVQPSGYSAAKDKSSGLKWSISKWNKNDTRVFAVEAQIKNANGKIIGTATVTLTNQINASDYAHPENSTALCVFRGVSIADYKDPVVAYIQKVNGRNVNTATNAYIKISPLDAGGFSEDGWDMQGYNRDGFDKEGYDRNGYDSAGQDRGGYNKDGYNLAGYDKAGYNKDGWDEDGYYRDGFNAKGKNRRGETRVGIARKNERKAAWNSWNKRLGESWGGGSIGGLISGGGNAQTADGFGEFALELGLTRWFFLDIGFGIGGGGLLVTDEMVEEKLGQNKVDEIKDTTGKSKLDWDLKPNFIFRLGASIPIILMPKVRLSAGGGFTFQKTDVEVKNGKKSTNKEGQESDSSSTTALLSFFSPYAEGRFDILLSSGGYSRFFGSIGYRADFPPASEMKTYYGKSVSVRHTVFVGFSGAYRF